MYHTPGPGRAFTLKWAQHFRETFPEVCSLAVAHPSFSCRGGEGPLPVLGSGEQDAGVAGEGAGEGTARDKGASGGPCWCLRAWWEGLQGAGRGYPLQIAANPLYGEANQEGKRLFTKWGYIAVRGTHTLFSVS